MGLLFRFGLAECIRPTPGQAPQLDGLRDRLRSAGDRSCGGDRNAWCLLQERVTVWPWISCGGGDRDHIRLSARDLGLFNCRNRPAFRCGTPCSPGDISSLSLADTVITDTVEHFPERRPVLDGDFAWRRLPLGVPTVMDRFPTSVPPLENLCIPAVPSAPSSLPESEDDSSPNTPPELCRFLPTTCTENRTGITISFL